jgi:hypothetical protein
MYRCRRLWSLLPTPPVASCSRVMSTSTTGGSTDSSAAKSLLENALVVDPLGEHQGTLVWLYGIGDMQSHFRTVFNMMRLPGVRLVVPAAPVLPVSAFNEATMSSWFDLPKKPGRLEEPLAYEDDRLGILLVRPN